MPINLFHWPAAITLLVAGMLFAPQVVCSSEADTTDIDSASTPVIEFQAFSTAGQYADALAVAARVIDQASNYHSATRASLVEPLMKLAMVQKQSGDYLPATQAGELAIELIERNGGVFDPALVEPLVFLAQLEQDNGNHPAALERLYRAQHILHRTDGVMT
ncbi:MAG: tetratricopeptide repeat protein, partial [Gammaproteobacteria bacterium]|nr:tetratricopeptide repeat protein [Gammaproteobacteria bacterium]